MACFTIVCISIYFLLVAVMAHSVIIPRRTFFYAIGNTCADLLTETLPPEESLDLLLLGCGDPRSILYTAYADGVAGRHVHF